jgi:S-adenosylmethionine uptake transporter
MNSSPPAAPGLGVALYLLGVFLFALNDALGKWLVADCGVGQMVMLRSIGAAVVLAPMIAWMGIDLFHFSQWRWQSVRILATAADTFSFYLATRFLPLADVMTFYMAAPLIVIAVSAPLLGDRVERFRWIAVAVGFVGVLVALRPSPSMFTWASLLALFGAAMFALGEVATRKLRRSHWLPLVVRQFFGAGLIGATMTPFSWTTPGRFDLGLMFLLGVVSMICFIFIVRALAMARAAVIAPLQYSSIVWATIIGWLVWRDAPTWPIVLGNAIIIGSGLYLAARDVQWRAAVVVAPVALTPRE